MGIKRGKVNSIADFEKKFDKKTNNTNTIWPTRLGGKNGKTELEIRFLTEPDGWIYYEQYWDPQLNRPVIATDENEEAYEARNLKPGVIYLASAIDVETNAIIVVELKWSLVKKIKAVREQYENKFGPLTAYDIVLKKTGSTKEDTEYHAFFNGASPLDVDRYEVPGGNKTWQDYLWTVVEKLLGNDDDAEVEDSIEEDTDLGDDAEVESEDTEEEKSAPKRRVVRKKVNA